MNTNDEQDEIDWIERYLRNQLSKKEQEQIEARMRHNPDFSKKVEQLRHITRLVRTAHVEQTARQTLQQLYKQRPVPIYRLRHSVWLSASAVAATIALLVYLAFSSIQLPQVADDLLVVKGPEPDSVDVGSTSVYTRMLAGQRAVQQGNYLRAINYLNGIPQRTELRSYFREAARWYLALAYLNSDQAQAAQAQLDALRQLDHPEFAVDRIERWKLYLQIQRKRWL